MASDPQALNDPVSPDTAASGSAAEAAFEPISLEAPSASIRLEVEGTYRGQLAGNDNAEPPAYDPDSQRLFVVSFGAVDVVDMSNPSDPEREATISTLPFGGVPSAVEVADGIVAVAVDRFGVGSSGRVLLFDADGRPVAAPVTVGEDPSDIAFTPDGRKLVVAGTGEPSDDYDDDPEGTVTVIDLGSKEEFDIFGVEGFVLPDVEAETIDFQAFDAEREQLIAEGVRLYGPGASVAEDLEPVAVTVSPDSATAWVSLQENNAFAAIDLEPLQVTDIFAAGTKDHSLPGNTLDASDQDDAINLRNWPVSSFFAADDVDAYSAADGNVYLVTANEGDPRDFEAFSEVARVGELTLDPAFPLPEDIPDLDTLQQPENLGRLIVTNADGDIDGDGDYDQLFMLGSRSFAIWTADGQLVFDSGDDFERITAEAVPDFFNTTDDANAFDERSDSRGPEPEQLAVGQIGSRSYAFVANERIGGVFAYDITDPSNPSFQQYINNRNFAVDPEDSFEDDRPPSDDFISAGDLGPEGVLFISEEDSPTGEPLVALSHEISNTVTLYSVSDLDNTFIA